MCFINPVLLNESKMSWPVSLSEDADVRRAIAALSLRRSQGQVHGCTAIQQGIDSEDNSETTQFIPALLKLNRALCSSRPRTTDSQYADTFTLPFHIQLIKGQYTCQGDSTASLALFTASLKHALAISFVKITCLR